MASLRPTESRFSLAHSRPYLRSRVLARLGDRAWLTIIVAATSLVVPLLFSAPSIANEGAEAPSSDPAHGSSHSSSAGARAERDRSRTKYRDQTPAEAHATARRWHPGATVEPLWAPIDPPPGHTVKRYLDQDTALVETERDGNYALAESLLPLLTDRGPGPATPVDPSLRSSGGAFEPANPLADLSLPVVLSDGIELPDVGVGMAPRGAERAADGISEDNRVFWADFARDADLIAEPLPGGVEVSAQLRSAQSPEQVTLDFALPAGAALVEAEGGGIEIVRDGERLAVVGEPAAWDADGVEVPVSFQLSGPSLVIEVGHAGGDFLYPILLDPPVIEDHRYWSSNSSLGQGGWRYRNCGPTDSSWLFSNALTTRSFGRGLYTYTSGLGGTKANHCWEWYWRYYVQPRHQIFGDTSVFIYAASFYQFRVDNDRPHCGTVGLADKNGVWNQTYGICSDVGYVDVTRCVQAGCPSNPSTGGDNEARMRTTINVAHGCCYEQLDTYLGGALLYVNDLDPPIVDLTGATSQPTDPADARLMDAESHHINIIGTDPRLGIGIKDYRLHLPGSAGTHVRSDDCTGGAGGGSRCFSHSDSDDSAYSGDSFTINTAELPNGLHEITYDASDVVGNVSEPGRFYMRIDHSKPVIQLAGSLYEHRGETLDHGVYRLDITADDVGPAGVKSLELTVDGRQQIFVDESCDTKGCCSASPADPVETGCADPAKAEYHFSPELEATGEHEITVIATDALGHRKQRTFSVTVDPSKECSAAHVDAQRSVPEQEVQPCALPDPAEIAGELAESALGTGESLRSGVEAFVDQLDSPPRDSFDGSCDLAGEADFSVEEEHATGQTFEYWTLDADATGDCEQQEVTLSGTVTARSPAILELGASYVCRSLGVNLEDGSSGSGTLTLTKGNANPDDDTIVSVSFKVLGSEAAGHVLRLVGKKSGDAVGSLVLSEGAWGGCNALDTELETELQTVGALTDDE